MQLRTLSSFRFGLPRTGVLSRLRYRAQALAEPEQYSLPFIEDVTPRDAGFRGLSFTFAVIALCAKVAFADGHLTRGKYVAFREAFPLTGGLCGKLRKLFLLACHNPTPFERYVAQIRQLYPNRPEIYRSLLARLFSVATADGDISREADRLLARISHALGISAADYSDLRERCLAPRPHQVLGIEKRAPKSQLKKHYHALMRRWHPDRFASETLSPEVELLIRLKTSEISQAYRALSRKAA